MWRRISLKVAFNSNFTKKLNNFTLKIRICIWYYFELFLTCSIPHTASNVQSNISLFFLMDSHCSRTARNWSLIQLWRFDFSLLHSTSLRFWRFWSCYLHFWSLLLCNNKELIPWCFSSIMNYFLLTLKIQLKFI